MTRAALDAIDLGNGKKRIGSRVGRPTNAINVTSSACGIRILARVQHRMVAVEHLPGLHVHQLAYVVPSASGCAASRAWYTAGCATSSSGRRHLCRRPVCLSSSITYSMNLHS